MRMLVAFGFLLGAPLLLILLPSLTLSVLLTAALVGGMGYVAYALLEVVRAYRRWAVRRAARAGATPARRRLVLAALLAIGAVAGLLLLPSYLAYAALSGMTSAGVSPSNRGHDTISLAGLTAVVIVALLVFIAPALGIAYVLLTAFLFWFHRTRLRIGDRAPSVGVGGLIDWLEHDAARA